MRLWVNPALLKQRMISLPDERSFDEMQCAFNGCAVGKVGNVSRVHAGVIIAPSSRPPAHWTFHGQQSCMTQYAEIAGGGLKVSHVGLFGKMCQSAQMLKCIKYFKVHVRLERT